MRNLHILFMIMLFSWVISADLFAQQDAPPYDVFSFEQQLTLPGSPEAVFDNLTGDISAWWDHSFSDNPYKLFIEPKPGGGFYEIFDEEGNGVKHATVIYADRGKMLRMDGPLGLSGKAIQMVTTYSLEPSGEDSTVLKLSVHCAGEVQEGISAIVESVWHHFMFDRFKPYMEKK